MNKKNKTYKIRKGIIFRNIDNIYFLIDIHNKNYFSGESFYNINKTGAIIWNIIKENENINFDGLLSKFIKFIGEYTKEIYEKIILDVSAFVNNLIKIGYLLEDK